MTLWTSFNKNVTESPGTSIRYGDQELDESKRLPTTTYALRKEIEHCINEIQQNGRERFFCTDTGSTRFVRYNTVGLFSLKFFAVQDLWQQAYDALKEETECCNNKIEQHICKTVMKISTGDCIYANQTVYITILYTLWIYKKTISSCINFELLNRNNELKA